jgi:prolyl-tRNA editing enzyme YbaK/EbsC (Cys-tRNA(Pro) deacylase)
MDEAVALTGMEYGGITPIGLPPNWPVLVDQSVAQAGEVVIGSGIRASKILLGAASLSLLPGARVVNCSATTSSGVVG